MTQPEKKRRGNRADVSLEELEAQEAAELPDREAMSLLDANVAIPVNAAVAANVLSEAADAGQAVDQTSS